MEEIQHFSREWHPLVLCHKNKYHQTVCKGCSQPIRGAAYECSSCRFCLHKSCTELPLEIQQHPLHPSHPLTLLHRSPYEFKFSCKLCDDCCVGFTYHCRECKFDLDVECALENLVGDLRIIMHESYNHSLTESYIRSASTKCSGCELHIHGEAYVCNTSRCRFFLHKSCFNLPKEIENHFNTAMTFRCEMDLHSGDVFLCSVCDVYFAGFEYINRSDFFSMNARAYCAFLKPSLKLDLHEHPLTSLKRKQVF